jgi:hypothetical protein
MGVERKSAGEFNCLPEMEVSSCLLYEYERWIGESEFISYTVNNYYYGQISWAKSAVV